MLHHHLTLLPPAFTTLWAKLRRQPRQRPAVIVPGLPLTTADVHLLPEFVTLSPVAMHYWHLLGALDWAHFPERPTDRLWPGVTPLGRAPFVAAFLVKLDQQLPHMTDLRNFLVAHPALTWLLGFDLMSSAAAAWGLDVAGSLPGHRQFSRILRTLPNPALQFLLDSTIYLIRSALPPDSAFGEKIALDTKHILAWVKENNPNRYSPHRYDKTIQPQGDPDCRLGCKERSNQRPKVTPAQKAAKATATSQPTPTTNPVPADSREVGTFYWGYASGIVTVKLPGWGEFVLAEYTQPFNAGDTTYFHPLMAAVERRLGFRPRFGALDAAFDAFYIYDYFAQVGGFAAVPLAERGRTDRTFDSDGLPFCDAGFPMPLKSRFADRSHLVPHEKGRYVCPLLYPVATGQVCPLHLKKWADGGCVTTLATSPGARIRYQLDRSSGAYTSLYAQRTTTERIFSQAKDLGIERPKLRNRQSITNLNTLTYVLLNLYAWQRCLASHRLSGTAS